MRACIQACVLKSTQNMLNQIIMLAGQKERKNTLALTYVKTLKTILFL
jgi:hypothetical protein